MDVTCFDLVPSRRGTESLKWDSTPCPYPLWVADMDFPTADVIRDAIAERAASGILGYSICPPDLGEVVSHWWGGPRHLSAVSADLITPVGGVIPALSSTIRTVTSPGEYVALFTPVYGTFFNCILNSGRRMAPISLSHDDGGYSIDWARAEAVLSDPQVTALVMCNPHNPTGTAWSPDDLARLADMAARHSVFVISDEIHGDLTMPGIQHYSWPGPDADLSRSGKWVTLVSPSKSFNVAGIQSGAALCSDHDVRGRLSAGFNRDHVGEMNIFAAPVIRAAYSDAGAEWLDALRSYLHGNRVAVEKALGDDRASRAGLGVVGGQVASYLMWATIDLSAAINTDAVTSTAGVTNQDCHNGRGETDPLAPEESLTQRWCRQLLDRAGVRVSPGDDFGPEGEGHIRINMACPRAHLLEAIAEIVNYASSL